MNTAQVEELVLEKQDTIWDVCTAVELSVKTLHSTVHEELGYSRVYVARCVMEVHKNWCLEMLFKFFGHLNFWIIYFTSKTEDASL
jgi:hypothetical protein